MNIKTNSKGKLFIVVNVDWFFLSHRLPIAHAAKAHGYDVTVLAIEEEAKGEEIRSHGFRFVPLPSSRGGKNIFSELNLVRFLTKLYYTERPNIVHHVAIKPVLYGSLAAKICRVPKVVNAVSGLGSIFISRERKSPLLFLVKKLYRFSLNNKNVCIIAQNDDDRNELLKLIQIETSQVKLIKGSGVDLNLFSFSEEKTSNTIQVLLPSRMLWDKGVGEFVQAAKILKAKFKEKVDFVLAGKVDNENISRIPKEQLIIWNEEGNVRWIGHQSNMVELYINAHIVVLPSYREGLPKSLIEACAIGRPIVTTNVPGCKETVDNAVNGFLVPAKDVDQLAASIEQLLLNKNMRKQMGLKGRAKAEKEFSIENVINKTLEIYES